MFVISLLISADRIMLLYLADEGLKWGTNTQTPRNKLPVFMQMPLIAKRFIKRKLQKACDKQIVLLEEKIL